MKKTLKNAIANIKKHISLSRLEKKGRSLSDYEYLEKKFCICLNTKKVDLNCPKTFNEKMQWIKMNDRKDIYTIMADKYLARDFVKNKIGDKYLIPLLGVYDEPNDIDFNQLPNQFVLKCNHNSGGGMCICTDKEKLNLDLVKQKLGEGLKQDYFESGREWPYKNIERKIVCEKYLTQDDGQLIDYKIWCFNERPKVIMICSDRFTNLKIDFFGIDFKKLPIQRAHPNSNIEIENIDKVKEMLELAGILSEGTLFLRVDFYLLNNQIYFGEMTFFPGSGFEPFNPEEWDTKFGSMLRLPIDKP